MNLSIIFDMWNYPNKNYSKKSKLIVFLDKGLSGLLYSWTIPVLVEVPQSHTSVPGFLVESFLCPCSNCGRCHKSISMVVPEYFLSEDKFLRRNTTLNEIVNGSRSRWRNRSEAFFECWVRIIEVKNIVEIDQVSNLFMNGQITFIGNFKVSVLNWMWNNFIWKQPSEFFSEFFEPWNCLSCLNCVIIIVSNVDSIKGIIRDKLG